MNRWFELAEEVSKKSEYPRIKIGAVIVKGNYMIATGYNQQKSHPLQAKLNNSFRDWESNNHYLHAEVHALIQSSREEDLKGADIYVFRRDRNGDLAASRPCNVCYNAIKAAGIQRIYYTTTEEKYVYEEV